MDESMQFIISFHVKKNLDDLGPNSDDFRNISEAVSEAASETASELYIKK